MDEYIEIDLGSTQELLSETTVPEPLPDNTAFQTDVVLFFALCLGIIFGAILGKAFMGQWKVGV